MQKDIYSMKLHEKIVLDNGYLTILRVVNGWIYTQQLLKGAITSTFVPERVINYKEEDDDDDDF